MQSYSAGIKEYLCRKTAYEVGLGQENNDEAAKKCDKCCALAFFYGVMLFARQLKRDTMTISIENEALLEICTYIMIHYFLATPEVKQIERSGKKKFEVTFGHDLVGCELLERLADEKKDYSFACKCGNCKNYFFRGVFLSAGTISDPELDYRVELLFKDGDSARAVCDFLGESFSPRTVKRRSDHVTYIKGGERVEDFCAAIGAEKASLDIMTTAIEKETMNVLNRNCNCEAANLRKTINASVDIRRAITKLRENGRFFELSEDLQQTAELRENYPEATLAQLAAMTDGAISRSGINHRLKKLIALSEE